MAQALSPRLQNDNVLPQDPFGLERLAEELENREKTKSSKPPAEEEPDVPSLPAYVPLSHGNQYLQEEEFNVEQFLLSRSYTSLPDLRAELREYLATLKEELVKLINDDYEAFISLSTDLRDEGVRLERAKQPLGGMRAEILKSKQELCLIQGNIQDKLRKRAILREEKALLQLLLKISDSVTRLEKLLAISSPEQNDVDSLELNNSNLALQLTSLDDTSDEKLPANRAKHLARVAAEYTQLLYHVSKARAEKCLFINGIQWRVDRIHSTLSSDLDSLFSTTLTYLTDGKPEVRNSELERTKWIADLTECLRTYDILGLWRDAEDLIRSQVVRKFVKKTIYPGALAVPPSPLVPHTPFHPHLPEPLLSATFPGPHTPYTPFTAFIPKQGSSFNFRDGSSAAPKHQAYLLDDSDNSLAQLYNQILRFVERDLGYILDATDALRSKSTLGTSEKKAGERAFSDVHPLEEDGFSILANVVWDELARAIQDEIGVIVFAAGRTDEFRKNHETTQLFLRSLELLAPSQKAVEDLRSHESYKIFERRWQLPVYFQLRWKEIIGKLEETLSVQKLEPSDAKELSPFVTPQAAAVWVSISACWSAEVFIPELCSRFWRLTLQILSRYKTWLSICLEALEVATPAEARTGPTTSGPRPSTPVPGTETPAMENTAADDAVLRQYSAAIIDILAMESIVRTAWEQEISLVLPDLATSEEARPEDALNVTLSKLTSLIPTLSVTIISILARRCSDALLPVRSIPSQFRAMSNKRMPAEPSYFVSSVLRPVRQFFAIGAGDALGAHLKERFLEEYATEIFNTVTARYINYLSAMKKTEESLKRLKKGKKTTFSLFGNQSNDEGRDEERIREQMILDAEAFGRDAQLLGVNLDTNEQFQTLKEMVYANDDN